MTRRQTRRETSPTRGGAGASGRTSSRPLRIAHAYGNTRDRLRAALAAPIDVIELDAWYRAGQVWVRHERRLGFLPLLVDKQMPGHSLPPLSLPLGRRWYVRLDINRLKLDDVLDTVAGSKGLLVDVKGSYRGRRNLEFAQSLVRKIGEHAGETWVAVCGQQWPVLDDVRAEAPGLEVRYSVERPDQWEKFMRLVGDDERVRRVCIEHRFLNEERALFLDQRGVDVFCWTVDNRDRAQRLVDAGVDGVISNAPDLLAGLRSAVRDQVNGGGLESGDDAGAGHDR